MGNSSSGDTGRYRHGYHVLRVKEGSPAFQAGLRPFFDYIMAVNGIRLDTESMTFREQMEASEDKPMVLDVYSTREQALRKIEMIPTKKWGDDADGLVGCSIRFTLFDTINDVVWHVLDIALESPAEQAGLCAFSDYIIGTPLGVMRAEGDLYDLVEDSVGEPLPLHVYNVDTNQVREVVIVPREDWGGDGLLGCNVGYGYLHRLPKSESQAGNVASSGAHESTHHQHGTESKKHAETPDEHATGRGSEPRNDGQQGDSASCGQSPGDGPLPKSEPVSPSQSTNVIEPQERSEGTGAASTGSGAKGRRPPAAIAARMMPSAHGKGGRMGHDGFPAADRISLQAAQNQAQQQSALYRDQQEDHDTESDRPRPPLALAARMMPGTHGKGERIGHDGFPVDDRISLQAVQDQAQQQSALYRDQKESHDAEHKARRPPAALAARMMPSAHGKGGRMGHDGFPVTDKRISLQAAQKQAQQSALYRDQMEGHDAAQAEEGSQNADTVTQEHVVEGMIRNMYLGGPM